MSPNRRGYEAIQQYTCRRQRPLEQLVGWSIRFFHPCIAFSRFCPQSEMHPARKLTLMYAQRLSTEQPTHECTIG